MKLILVRHSQTVDAKEWHEKVELRPLSKNGMVRAEIFGRILEKKYGHSFEYFYSSEYFRAIQTAEILRSYLKPLHFIITDCLNPEESPESFIEILKKTPIYKEKLVLAVTHTPLIEKIVFQLTNSNSEIHFKKPSMCELLISDEGAELVQFFNYDDLPDNIKIPIKPTTPYDEEIEEILLG